MNFKKLFIAIAIAFTSFNLLAADHTSNNNDPSVFEIFTNMEAEKSMQFMEDMGITTETYGREIFFIYNGSPAFILNKNTEYLIIPDPNGGFTIESEKSFVMGNLTEDDVLEFSHLNKKKMKIKRYKKS